MTRKGNLTGKEKIIAVLTQKGVCTFEELLKHTGLKESVLNVYLSQLAKEGVISRGWLHYDGKRFRKYSLKSKYKEELKLDD
ncbi:winged helix-turn-helix transcriptional regulator [Sulfolobus tengchongensis]|uniref:Winged helix-turn-helix transcriptional regulator n=1 Tax=Sulfolobus tengchongensis TaxID=207809 RepID=A0AAX4L0C8_9CREN